jgi:ubiquinone/menaquinone biosynthesis C-methylase UbiE
MPQKEKRDTVEQYLQYLRHLAAYVFTEKFARNRSMLEIGCGTGYGADHLSQLASSVVSVDIRKEAVSYCQDKCKRENLVFLEVDGLKLPFKDNSFDIVISFQVIEHIDPNKVLDYLSEAKRVLNKDGIFILSTPNSKLRLLPFQKPWNPEHKKEYDYKGLRNLLNKVFDEVKVYSLVGSEEIQFIERNRVKQNPFKVYIATPFKRYLKKLFPFPILFQLKKVKNSIKFKESYAWIPDDVLESKFSVNDFRVYSGFVKDCIDLYGVCAKEAERLK